MADPNEPLIGMLEGDPKAMLKKKALVKAAKQKEMMQLMQEKLNKDHPSHGTKNKPVGYAKGGKVRGCGCARKGFGKAGSRGR
jgi:hypothetical protein